MVAGRPSRAISFCTSLSPSALLMAYGSLRGINGASSVTGTPLHSRYTMAELM